MPPLQSRFLCSARCPCKQMDMAGAEDTVKLTLSQHRFDLRKHRGMVVDLDSAEHRNAVCVFRTDLTYPSAILPYAPRRHTVLGSGEGKGHMIRKANLVDPQMDCPLQKVSPGLGSGQDLRMHMMVSSHSAYAFFPSFYGDARSAFGLHCLFLPLVELSGVELTAHTAVQHQFRSRYVAGKVGSEEVAGVGNVLEFGNVTDGG